MKKTRHFSAVTQSVKDSRLKELALHQHHDLGVQQLISAKRICSWNSLYWAEIPCPPVTCFWLGYNGSWLACKISYYVIVRDTMAGFIRFQDTRWVLWFQTRSVKEDAQFGARSFHILTPDSTSKTNVKCLICCLEAHCQLYTITKKVNSPIWWKQCLYQQTEMSYSAYLNHSALVKLT